MEGSRGMQGQLKKMDFLLYRAERLDHLCSLMPREARIEFEKSYGRVLDLMKICVDPAFLRALVHFWRLDLHCFEFPQFDLVPTLEEYELMLRWPKSAGVYIFHGNHVAVERVATQVKLPSRSSALVGTGSIKGWKLAMLEDHLSSLAGEGDWLAFNKTLALAVFGTILFPFHANTVDQAAMDAFFAWDVHMKSPVPAILADTLLSVNLAQQKQGKTIRCCTSLLYVWGITHFYASSHMGTLPDPLRSFSKIPVRRRYASEWKEEMEQWSIEHLTWVCPWFRPSNVLTRCGNYPSIPLMGLRGCIAYSPRLAMRQLMRTQITPTREELGGLCFSFDSEHQRDMHAVIRAWEKPIYEGDRELGKPRVSASTDYEIWRSERGVSQPSTSGATTTTRRSTQEQVDALTKKLEIMGAQMRVLEEKNEESSFIIDGLQRQCKKKDHEIERLKDEYANLNEEAARASKMPKIEPSSQLQEVNAKIARLEAEHARQAQLIKDMQEDLLSTRSDAQQWREVAQQQTASLSDFRKREREGLAQMAKLQEEKDRAEDELNELQAMINYHTQKAKDAQKNSDDLSQAVHMQVEAMRRHVEEAEDEWRRKMNPPVGFYRLFSYCKKLLQSIV